ncbi:hypothetical protein TN53_43040, partial [Streptomyces sp. WM6386]
GLHPTVETVDATGPLPAHEGQFDRIVATVAVRSIPSSWLTALSPAVTGQLTKPPSPGHWERAGVLTGASGADLAPAH